MGDADFVPVPTKGLLDARPTSRVRSARSCPAARLTPNPAAAAIRARSRPPGSSRARAWRCAAPVTGPENGTTHFSVVDKWGNMVVVHEHHRVRRTASACSRATRRGDGSFRNHGFLLNNELTDFNTDAEHQPVHRRGRLQRRAAWQAPAQQHDADDDLHARRQAVHRLRLAGRRDDHQLGAQRHDEPDRPQDGACRRRSTPARISVTGAGSDVHARAPAARRPRSTA